MQPARNVRLLMLASMALCFRTLSVEAADTPAHCAPQPQACLALALAAMGGRERLEAVNNISIEGIQHTLLVEQSYRQDPFITSYVRTQEQIDFTGQRL